MIRPTSWGEREIRGPVHLFRERMLLRQVLPFLGDAGRILDAGCGSGSLALELQRAGYRVEALERSAEFVDRLRRETARYGAESRIALRRGSVAGLPFRDQVFDGAVCAEVLEHVLPQEGGDAAAVSELRRVLKAGAPLVVSVPLNPKLWDQADEWAGHVKRYRKEELVELLTSAGFVVGRVKTWGFPLGRVYHRWLFRPWVRRTAGMDFDSCQGRADTRAAGNRVLVEAAAGLLRFDELFSGTGLGRGVIVTARRR